MRQPARIEVMLPDRSTYAHTGTLDFSDLAVDPGTGAVSLRAVIPNPDHSLLPGMFVNLRLTVGEIDPAFLFPHAAITRDAQGAYVLIVGPDGKVVQRRVETHGMTSTDWIVTGDLNKGDQVITEGLQKVRPGAFAKAIAAPPKDAPPGAGAATQS